MPTKDKVLDKYKVYKTEVENLFDTKTKRLNKGGEYHFSIQ